VGGVITLISGVCDFACLSVYPNSKRKMAGAINSKAGRHTVHDSHSACIDSEIKKVRGQGHTVIKCPGLLRFPSAVTRSCHLGLSCRSTVIILFAPNLSLFYCQNPPVWQVHITDSSLVTFHVY